MAIALKLMANDATATAADEHAALCTLGDLAIRLDKPAEAVRTLELALRVNPRSVFALVKLGQLASRAGQGDQAVSDYEKALAAVPNQVAIRGLLAAEYRRRGDLAKAATLAVPNDPNRKEAIVGFPDPLYAAVAEQNRSGARQNRLGTRQLEVGRCRQALDHFARGVQADPESSVLHANHGYALLAMGRVEDGQKELEEARRLDPGSDAYRATLYAALARLPATWKRALDEAGAWRKEQSGKPFPLQTLAEVQARVGHYQDALQTYVDLEKLDPTRPGPRIGQARMLAALGKGPEARRTLEAAAKLLTDDADIAVNLARLLATSPDGTVRDGAKALTMIQRLIAGEYTVTRGETLALALAETGQYDKALQVQRKAIADCGDDGEVMVRKRLDKVLQSLEQKKPWREPWPFRDPNPDDSTMARN